MDTSELRQNVSSEALGNIEKWLSEPKYAEYRAELEQTITEERWQELEDAFFKVIEFGTAGRRGTTGLGSNRINRVTVGESAQALCQYAAQADPDAPSKGVVIACDTRLSSPELSRYCASVAAANGFKAYIFESYRSTPELSFAVRHLGCAVGIVITASHNPPADNGFKAYWSDGGQVSAPHDKGILEVAARIEDIEAIDYGQAVADGKIIEIGTEVDEAYIAVAAAQAEGTARNVVVAYSPLHGAGQRNTLPVLERAGFAQVIPVAEQMVPDGNFPSVENGRPNPEDTLANALAVATMMAHRADIAITNDPDADRIGIMVRRGDDVEYLSGNQAAVLATDYVLSARQAKGMLDGRQYVAKTFVSSDLISAVAVKYDVECVGNLPVGFKYFAKLILGREGADREFLLGAEESFGMLKGDYARDKDGATGALPVAEYAAELKAQGKTLWDRLLELYQEHGLYLERLDNIMYPGADGFARMQAIMAALRAQPPTEIEGHNVTAVNDYLSLTRRDLTSGAETPIDNVSSNVIVLECDNDTRRRFTIRPSGTEPKIKVYTQWFEVIRPDESVQAQYDALTGYLEGLGETIEGILLEEK